MNHRGRLSGLAPFQYLEPDPAGSGFAIRPGQGWAWVLNGPRDERGLLANKE